ncbi:MAG TPA: tRNA lysidine(34) synthetase TilS, partial [Candidatus Baltobacteraceae bacterium]|nr:tRNA lysidine(34) synthetase TilS [Candidatus Baltobacteraceae bacterium]
QNLFADFELIEMLRLKPNQFISVGTNISVARNESGEIKLREEFKSKFNANELAVNLSGGAGEAGFSGTKFKWKFLNGARGRSLHQEFFDADKIGGKITLRHWRAGDRFQPIGMKSLKKLQDLFVNAKIPAAQRRVLILAVAESGEIFWVEGLRISENFKITSQTKRQLVWKWRKIA